MKRVFAPKKSLRDQVESFFEARGARGATADSCVASLGFYFHNSIAPRITELRQDRILLATGVQRATRCGGWAEVLMHRKFLRRSKTTAKARVASAA